MSPRLEFSPYRDSFEGHTECTPQQEAFQFPRPCWEHRRQVPILRPPKCPLEAPAAPATRPHSGREKRGSPEGSALCAGQPLAEALGSGIFLLTWIQRLGGPEKAQLPEAPCLHGWVGRVRHPLLQRGQAVLEGGWGIPASSSASRCSPITEPRVWLRGAALRPWGPGHLSFHLLSPLTPLPSLRNPQWFPHGVSVFPCGVCLRLGPLCPADDQPLTPCLLSVLAFFFNTSTMS